MRLGTTCSYTEGNHCTKQSKHTEGDSFSKKNIYKFILVIKKKKKKKDVCEKQRFSSNDQHLYKQTRFSKVGLKIKISNYSWVMKIIQRQVVLL